MNLRSLPVVAALSLLLCDALRADGLIFQLPADGTEAEYSAKMDAEFTLGNAAPQKISTTGTLSVASVGIVQRADQECRWIELKLKNDGDDEGLYRQLNLKMLIPTDRLQRGHDPLSHSVSTFFSPKPSDKDGIKSFIETGVNRVQYEIDRFRDVFPKPFENSIDGPKENIDTPAGQFADCEVLRGTSGYDGPLLADGRMVYTAKYQIALHPDAPFGVVRLQAEVEGREVTGKGLVMAFKTTKTLTLAKTSNDATSDLP